MTIIIGRANEQQALDRLVELSRRGESGALVLRGGAGTGRTVLLDYAASVAHDLQCEHVSGVEVESVLPFRACTDS